MDGVKILRLPLDRLFPEISDHVLIVLPSDGFTPNPVSGDELQIFTELERNVGKSRITLIVGESLFAKYLGSGAKRIPVDQEEFLAALCRRSLEQLKALLLKLVPPSLLNPYQSDRTVAPSMFFGRRDEVEDLCEARHSYVVFGARRIGKSSLAQRVHRELKAYMPYGYSYGKGGREADWYSVAHVELHRLASTEDLWGELLTRMGFSMRELRPGAKFRVSLRDKRKKVEQLTEFEIIRRILTKKSMRALFLLDEADRSIRLDCDAGYPIFSQLQSLLDDPECNLRVVLFGYEALLRAWHSGDFPLNFTRLHKMNLGPLTAAEVGQLLEEPMQRIGVRVENPAPARDYIHAATGGMPNLVQDLCQCLLVLDSVNLARLVTMKDVDSALKSSAFLERIDLQFGQVTEALPRLIAFLMSESQEFRLETVLDAIIRSRLPVNDNDVEYAIEQLVLYNIIEVAGQSKEYVFSSHVMRARLKSQATESRLNLLKKGIVVEHRGRFS